MIPFCKKGTFPTLPPFLARQESHGNLGNPRGNGVKGVTAHISELSRLSCAIGGFLLPSLSSRSFFHHPKVGQAKVLGGQMTS